jgi:hypothetical protein
MDERRVVYVLRSERDHPARHYVWLTADVSSRLADHNAGGSAHTAKSGVQQPVRVEPVTPGLVAAAGHVQPTRFVTRLRLGPFAQARRNRRTAMAAAPASSNAERPGSGTEA